MKAGVGTKKHKKETQKIARLKGWSHAKKTLTTDGLMQNEWMNEWMNTLFAKTNIFMALLRMSGRLVRYQLLFNRIQTSIIIADGAFLFVNLPALLCTAAPSTQTKKTKVVCTHASSFYVGGGHVLFCRFLKISSKSTPLWRRHCSVLMDLPLEELDWKFYFQNISIPPSHTMELYKTMEIEFSNLFL